MRVQRSARAQYQARALNRPRETFDPRLLDFMKELFSAYEHQRSIDQQMTTLDKILDATPTSVSIDWVMARPDGRLSIGIAFSEQGFGFGEITLVQTPQGLFLNSECMRLETVKRFIDKLLEGAIADYDKDPERHKKYNEVMGRQCGEGCKICHEEGPTP